MKFNVISIMPKLIEGALHHGVVGQAFQKNICDLSLVNPRDYTSDTHKTVDDRPFGGGDGMLMMAEPLEKALASVEAHDEIYYLSPQGKVFNDQMAREFATKKELTLICGRYGGVDQRFLNKNKIKEISIGDFVLSGGELAAVVILDAVARHIPGVLGHSASANEDSFANGLLEPPYYTRPQEWGGLKVPPILLSGDHNKIRQYKDNLSLLITLIKRPDLVKDSLKELQECLNYISNLDEENFWGMPFNKQDALKHLKESLDG